MALKGEWRIPTEVIIRFPDGDYVFPGYLLTQIEQEFGIEQSGTVDGWAVHRHTGEKTLKLTFKISGDNPFAKPQELQAGAPRLESGGDAELE